MDEDTAAASTRRTDGPSRRGPREERERGRPPSWLTTRLGRADSLIERCHSADKKRPVEYLNESRPSRGKKEREREREREARIGGPKFRVSSWLINRSPDLFTPQGIGPLWLTSRIDACQLTMANRSLRLVLALPSLVIVQTVCPFCLGSGNHAMNRSRQLKASAC